MTDEINPNGDLDPAAQADVENLENDIAATRDEMTDLGTVALKVTKGKATLQLGTLGAKVVLVNGATRKEVPQFPMAIEFDTNEKWELTATKDGFDELKQPITFEDGQAERTFTITLTPKGAAPLALAWHHGRLRSPSRWVTTGGCGPAWNCATSAWMSASARETRACWRRCSAQDSTMNHSTMRSGSAASSLTPQAKAPSRRRSGASRPMAAKKPARFSRAMRYSIVIVTGPRSCSLRSAGTAQLAESATAGSRSGRSHG